MQILKLLAVVATLLLAPAAMAGTRVALVIANASYANVPKLANPPSDASLVASALRRAGFDAVEIAHDLDKAAMEAALQRFGDRAEGADLALVYYAGHGIEVAGRNYLIPVNARLTRDRDTDLEAVSLDSVLRVTGGARMRILVLDACRDNPFNARMQRTDGTRAVTRGLARVEPAQDTLVVYAAREGSVAADGSGANSPFASAMARRIVEPGVEVGLTFRRVRDDVLTATNRVQEPFTYGSLSGAEFYFVPAATVSSAPTAGGTDTEALLWQGVMRGDRIEGYRDYLIRYPSGAFSAAARANIARLETAASTTKGTPSGSVREIFARAQRLHNAGTPQDYAAAFPLWREAAALGEADAMNNVGWYYLMGLGVPVNRPEAIAWFTKAVDSGSALAMQNLGARYQYGDGVPKDYGRALELYRAGAAAGRADSMNSIGWFYQQGWGTSADAVEARRWYVRAAEKGDGLAMINLGSLYHNGTGVAKDHHQAYAWFKRAADAGHAKGWANVGWYKMNSWVGAPEYTEARRWSQMAAEKGEPVAMVNLAWLYENGRGGAQDRSEAMRWYRRAAELGNALGTEGVARLGG